MGTARAKLLAFLREADVHGRFQLYVPVTEGRRPIYVHAKVTVVDDRLLRIGSSNLNNRSMGLDTECDVSIEVRPGDPRAAEKAAAVTGLRDRLLGEHLGVPPDAVAKAVEACGGSLLQAVESLRRPLGRSLVPFSPPDMNPVQQALADTELLDAERTPNRWHRVRRSFRPRVAGRGRRR